MSTKKKYGNIYSVIRFCAHWLANCTIFILTYNNCSMHTCPRSLRPLSVIAEVKPNNYIFAFGMGTSALLTIILVITLHISVINFLVSKNNDRIEKKQNNNNNKDIYEEKEELLKSENRSDKHSKTTMTILLRPRALQLQNFSKYICIIGSASYFFLFIVTITHAHKQGFIHSFFGVLHFFTSWTYSVCVQILRLCLLDTYGGENDVDEENKSRAVFRFQISRYLLILLIIFDLAFGTLWIYVNIYSSQRYKYIGLESVLEVLAVLIQINYCCTIVFDSPGHCNKVIKKNAYDGGGGSGRREKQRMIDNNLELSSQEHKSNGYNNITKHNQYKNSIQMNDDIVDEEVSNNSSNNYSSDDDSSSDDDEYNDEEEDIFVPIHPNLDIDTKYKCKDMCKLFIISISPCIRVTRRNY